MQVNPSAIRNRPRNTDEESSVRIAAAQALGAMGPCARSAFPFINEALAKAKDEETRVLQQAIRGITGGSAD